MLNIPDSVKALFKQDGVYKNFRAHFPNGELADITNENIVQESVKFTESVCSQDVFKFGLTEASVIEFETVGVANMYGMTIECSCEIDCSSLSAADKAAIAAGTLDGTWNSVNEVFAVPYGTFRVESCPRDHQAMAHRKVTAYTAGIDSNSLYETKKMALFTNVSQYSPILDNVLYSTVFSKSPNSILDNGYEQTEIYLRRPSSSVGLSNSISSALTIHINGDGLTLFLCAATPRLNKYPSTSQYDDRVDFGEGYLGQTNIYKTSLFCAESSTYSTSLPTIYDEDVKEELALALQNSEKLANYNPEDDGYNGWSGLVDAFLERVTNKVLGTSFMEYVITYSFESVSGGVILHDRTQYVPMPVNTLIYPHYPMKRINSGTYYGNANIYPRILTNVSVVSSSISIGSVAEISVGSADHFYVYNKSDETRLAVTALNSTLEDKWNGKIWHSFSNAYSIMDAVSGMLELQAQFVTADRFGSNKIIRIDNTSPVPVIPGEYRQMWFDEYNVEPIGTIRYSYTDEAGEEQIVDYQFGDGESIYDMTDNEVLKMMDVADSSVIEAMLDAYFIPHLAPVNFVPVDLSMKGLPYLEAGDAISVTAQDGTVCNSYALRQEISGIQALEAQIDSQSGLIIESEAAT